MSSIITLQRSLLALLFMVCCLSFTAHALEKTLGTPTTVSPSFLAVPIAQADPATLLEATWQLRQTKPALFAGAQGVLIVNVVPGSQAAKKGLQPGDIVITYAGEAINSADQLIEAVQAKALESQVVLRVIRGEKVEKIGLKGGKIGVELRDIEESHLELDRLIEELDRLTEELEPLVEENHPELERLNEDAKQSYEQSYYPLALKKWQAGLAQARKLADKCYTSIFLGNLGMVYDELEQYPKALEYY